MERDLNRHDADKRLAVYLPEPFDKVLVKTIRTNEWFPDIFQIIKDRKLYVIGTDHPYDLDRVIPYEGNEALVGTNKEPYVTYEGNV